MSPNNALIFRFVTFIFAQSALRQNVSHFVFRHLDTMYFSLYKHKLPLLYYSTTEIYST